MAARPNYVFANKNYRPLREAPVEREKLLRALESEAPSIRRDAIDKLGRFFFDRKALERIARHDEDDRNRRLAMAWVDRPRERTLHYDLGHGILYPQHALGRSLEPLSGKVPAIVAAIADDASVQNKDRHAIGLSTKQRANLGIEPDAGRAPSRDPSAVGTVALESVGRKIRNVPVYRTDDIDEMNSPGIMLSESLAKALDLGVGEGLLIHSRNESPRVRKGPVQA